MKMTFILINRMYRERINQKKNNKILSNIGIKVYIYFTLTYLLVSFISNCI